MHPPFGEQPLDVADVALRPLAARAPGGEALAEGALVAPAHLAVDPPVAERLVERLVVGERGRLGRALLGEHELDPDLVAVVLPSQARQAAASATSSSLSAVCHRSQCRMAIAACGRSALDGCGRAPRDSLLTVSRREQIKMNDAEVAAFLAGRADRHLRDGRPARLAAPDAALVRAA